MGLYQKHRPKTFDQVIGNKSLITLLKNTCKDTSEIPHAILFVGPTGCVDCDTEFLSPSGWKYISDWKEGQKVMQYNADGTSEFVHPLQYIKKPSNVLQHIKTKYGIDQCLSLDHRFVYFLPKKGNKIYEKPFSEILEQNNNSKGGFTGKIETVFSPIKQIGIPYTDEQLRVQTMFIADGYLPEHRAKGCVSVKKKRKIIRVEKLLKEANIQYDKYQGSGLKKGYRQFHFIPPIRTKIFTNDFYSCTKEQLSVIANESLYWDAEFGEMRVYSTIKESIDFLQFAFAAIGVRTSIWADIRDGKNICYTLSGTKRHFTSMEQSKSDNKIKAVPYKTKDGFEYCFTVPSTYLVLRRNGNVFITGNCGKTSLARIVASELKCSSNNLIEIDTAIFNGVDTVRDINKSSQFTPLGGGVRIFIIDECHKLSTEAQNAFLKILEDTPEHIYFILCTTLEKSLIETVRGRCSRYQVSLLSDNEMGVLIESVCKKEKQTIEKEVLEQIVKSAQGHPRNALTILEQVLQTPEDKRLKVAERAQELEVEAIELCRALLARKNWGSISKILKSLKGQDDPESVRRMVLGYMSSVLLNKDEEQAGLVLECFEEPFYNGGFPLLVSACYKVVKS